MKSLIFTIVSLFAVSGMAWAQEPQQPKDTVQTQSQPQQNLTQIKVGELPPAVQASIQSPEYSGWQINSAYTNEDKSRYFVEMKKGTEMKSMAFDKDGKPIDWQKP